MPAMANAGESAEQVNVRSKWEHEALNFTPWLAKNLGVLGEAVGLTLEPVQQEQQVGSFSLDILARETNEDVMVAIENQLEWTDHSHLGQLLTYAAGCNARIAIWVADEFQYEHAEALHQLNQWAGTNIRFYGVKIDVIRATDNAPLEERLHTVVSPNGWDKTLTLPQPPPPPPHIQQFRYFFQPLIDKLLGKDFADKCVQCYSYQDRIFPSRTDPRVGYAAGLYEKGVWVSLDIRMEDNALTKAMFDKLEADREQIERSVDAGPNPDWRWQRFDRYAFSTIDIWKDGSIDDPPDKLEETRAWMLDMLPKFKEVFEPRLQKILN